MWGAFCSEIKPLRLGGVIRPDNGKCAFVLNVPPFKVKL